MAERGRYRSGDERRGSIEKYKGITHTMGRGGGGGELESGEDDASFTGVETSRRLFPNRRSP